MAYVDVEWSHNDTPTEAKLDQMQANLDYVRDVGRGRMVLQEAAPIIDFNIDGSGSALIRVVVGSQSWDSDPIVGAAADLGGIKNKSLVGLSGFPPAAILVSFVGNGGSPIKQKLVGQFFKYDDAKFLSVFATVAADSNHIQMYGFTIITTRDNEGF